MADVQIVFAANDSYFLLAKGLVLSIQSTGSMQPGFAIAFIDLGCSPEHLQWLRDQNVRVMAFDDQLMGEMARLAPGYLRALILRPYLPTMFPEAKAFVWLDSDLWLQSPHVLHMFAAMALKHADKLFICPECHYSYVVLNNDFMKNQVENFAVYYKTLYDEQTAREMAGRPLLNAGIFSMAASNPLWELWKSELLKLYSRNYGSEQNKMRHLAEQTALNVLVARNDFAIPVDPIFNYMCMYGMPYRDPTGKVRVSYPPNSELGAIHLSLWRYRRKIYMDRNLLYESGNYLTAAEKIAIFDPIT